MKHVVLHIGQYKTGSSSIQNFLTSHPDFLAENKVKFCDTGLLRNEPEVGIRHFKLAVNTATENCYWPDLVDEIKSGNEKTYIISYENLLFGLDEKSIAYVANKLKEFDVTIICYLRRQDNFFNSWYAELIKSHKGTMNKTKFLEHYHELGYYGRALQRWHKHFNKARFSIISFDTLKRDNQNVVDSFLQLINIPKPQSVAPQTENLSLGSKGVANMRAFNQSVDLRREIHRNVAKFFINYFKGDSKFRLFTKQEAESLVQQFASDYEKLIAEFNLPAEFFSNHYNDTHPVSEDAQLGQFMAQTCKDAIRFSV